MEYTKTMIRKQGKRKNKRAKEQKLGCIIYCFEFQKELRNFILSQLFSMFWIN